jgi:hypothetical protein
MENHTVSIGTIAHRPANRKKGRKPYEKITIKEGF